MISRASQYQCAAFSRVPGSAWERARSLGPLLGGCPCARQIPDLVRRVDDVPQQLAAARGVGTQAELTLTGLEERRDVAAGRSDRSQAEQGGATPRIGVERLHVGPARSLGITAGFELCQLAVESRAGRAHCDPLGGLREELGELVDALRVAQQLLEPLGGRRVIGHARERLAVGGLGVPGLLAFLQL